MNVEDWWMTCQIHYQVTTIVVLLARRQTSYSVWTIHLPCALNATRCLQADNNYCRMESSELRSFQRSSEAAQWAHTKEKVSFSDLFNWRQIAPKSFHNSSINYTHNVCTDSHSFCNGEETHECFYDEISLLLSSFRLYFCILQISKLQWLSMTEHVAIASCKIMNTYALQPLIQLECRWVQNEVNSIGVLAAGFSHSKRSTTCKWAFDLRIILPAAIH